MLFSAFFFTVTAAFCLPISMQPNQQQINNVPQRTLLSLRIRSTHGCAAARTLIRFTSLPSLPLSVSFTFSLMCAFSVSGMLEILIFSGHLMIFRSFPPPPHPSPLAAPYHIQRSAAFLFPTRLPPFFPPSALSSLSPTISPSHLSDLNTCIMHGEGKAVRRPACANNAPK